MSAVLATFDAPVLAKSGTAYIAQACGGENADGLWEGWIEFIPRDGGVPLRSPRETTQPNRADAMYWASGLTAIYLEGALERALNPLVRKTPAYPEPLFDVPAPGFGPASRPVAGREAILDPFSLYEKSEALLRKELAALAAWHLVNILEVFGLSDLPATALQQLRCADLIELIVSGVREGAAIKK